LVRPGHIRIIARAEVAEDGSLILHQAESTSATDIPCGQALEDGDIGPRLIQLKYPAPDHPIHEQSPLRERLSDEEYQADAEEAEYVLGRLQALDRLCRDWLRWHGE
jgi:hypothetical protein